MDEVVDTTTREHLSLDLNDLGPDEQITVSKMDLLRMFDDVWSAGRRSAFSEAE